MGWQMKMLCAEIHKTSAELFLFWEHMNLIFSRFPSKCSWNASHTVLWSVTCLSLTQRNQPMTLSSVLHVVYKPTQMSETCWFESLQGRAGYIIYTYCMYTIKLKALILSIVFNYLHFLMMKIDCTKLVVFFFFFIILCLCMLSPEQMKTLWMVHQYESHNC